MRHSFSRVVLGAGIVTAMILSLNTPIFAIADTGKPLADIEAILKRIETNRVVHPNDEGIDKFFDAYIEGVRKEARAAKGDKKKSAELKNVLKRHNEQLRTIENRLKNIAGRIKGGEIRLSKGILQAMNETETGEFKKFLLPAALNEYEKLHPEIFKPRAFPKTPPPTKGMNQDIRHDENISLVQDFLNFLPYPFVSPAYATDCEARCDGEVSRCLRYSCSCKWYKPWCCVARFACLVHWGPCFLACLLAG